MQIYSVKSIDTLPRNQTGCIYKTSNGRGKIHREYFLRGVGAEALCRNEKQLGALPTEASIFTAEAYALQLAINIIKRKDGETFVIFSDSLSVLRALQDPEPKHVMVRT